MPISGNVRLRSFGIWVFHDRHFCQIIWQIFTQGRAKKFIKNCPQWGLKPGPPNLQANALPTELGRNLSGRRFLKWALFVSCTTSHVGLCSFLESNRAWPYKGHEDSGWQLNVDLAQLVRLWPEDLEVLASIPTGGNWIFFALPCVKICHIFWQKRISWKTQLLTITHFLGAM